MLFVGIVGFLCCIIFGLSSTVGEAHQMYSSDSGIGYLLCY